MELLIFSLPELLQWLSGKGTPVSQAHKHCQAVKTKFFFFFPPAASAAALIIFFIFIISFTAVCSGSMMMIHPFSGLSRGLSDSPAPGELGSPGPSDRRLGCRPSPGPGEKGPEGSKKEGGGKPPSGGLRASSEATLLRGKGGGRAVAT